MRLERLAHEVAEATVEGDPSIEVSGMTHDSRAVVPGWLFCCVPGSTSDGHAHAPAAVASGAVALLVERSLGLGVPEIVVPDVRRAMGPAASGLHGHPSATLAVVGVTGTNGKTTTTLLLRSILEAAGRPTEVIGTLSGARTTPEAPELQARLAAARDAGRQVVAMEVSSHALALGRVLGTRFAVAVFTNLGRDHLDFHESIESYFAAKAALFEPRYSERAVVNLDDPYGRLLRDAAVLPTTGFSLATEVDDLQVGAGRSTGTWRGRHLVVPLGGRFNMANALAAATAAIELGVDEDDVIAGLAVAPPVPGRFELVPSDAPFSVVVDYAHTPDGLGEALRAARSATSGRVLVVFGCGGDRDREKRPAMGEVAARLADVVVLTSDNPRSEDPAAILAEIVDGARGGATPEVVADRRVAIATALQHARPGDLVVVAGKGHEVTQTIGEQVLPFDDRVVVAEELAALGLGDDPDVRASA